MMSGEAAEYHKNLSKALAYEYRLRPVTSSIDPHLTVKAPFDALSTDIEEIERIIDSVVRLRSPLSYTLKGFGNFEDRVVYMDIEDQGEVASFIKELKGELRNVAWLEFKPHEREVKLHATLCYPNSARQAHEIVRRLSEKGKREFTATFDTVALLKKEGRKWEILKEFRFGSDGTEDSSLADPFSSTFVGETTRQDSI